MIIELPAEMPETTPVVALTVATAVLVLLQVPPVPVLVNVITEPVHTNVVPLMVPAFESGLTVIAYVAVAVPQPVVTV